MSSVTDTMDLFRLCVFGSIVDGHKSNIGGGMNIIVSRFIWSPYLPRYVRI